MITVNDIFPNTSDLSKAGISFALHKPQPGQVIDERVISVEGILNSGWKPIAALELAGRGLRIKMDIPSGRRQDLPFNLQAGTLTLPAQFILKVNVRFNDDECLTVCTISCSQVPFTSDFEALLQPLMVTSLGRSGSTLLMKLLIHHPQIVAIRRHPYEVRAASYWMRVLKIFSSPRQPGETILENLFGNKSGTLGSNPFASERFMSGDNLRAWFSTAYPYRVARFCQENIEQYFHAVAADQGQENVSYFAEKASPSNMQDLLWGIYPQAREIFLLRDFRDTLCSILAFDEKRGFAGFGRKPGDDDLEFARSLGIQVQDIYDNWMERKDKAFLVRYEDLILEPRKALTDIFHYLDLELTTQQLEQILAISEQDNSERVRHQTSQSSDASIGRWKQDLSPALKQVCRESFGKTTTFFGYED